MSNTVVIDTGKVADRRPLRFESTDDILAEVDRLAEAERAGKLRRLGNWTLGQALGHLAAFIEYGYTGFPLKVPFFIRWILKLRKNKYLHEALPSGRRIPGVEGGTLAIEPLPLDEAVGRMRRMLSRLKAEPPPKPHVIFGRLTHQEWIAINARHAELHLSFFVPE